MQKSQNRLHSNTPTHPAAPDKHRQQVTESPNELISYDHVSSDSAITAMVLQLQRLVGNRQTAQMTASANNAVSDRTVHRMYKQLGGLSYFTPPVAGWRYQKVTDDVWHAQKMVAGVSTVLEVRAGPNDWTANVVGRNEQVAVFSFEDFDDDGKYWLMKANTVPNWQRNGIGLLIMKLAVSRYREVYASKGSQAEHRDDDDTRYLTAEGAALVNSCVTADIIKNEWYYNPMQRVGRGDDRDDMPDGGDDSSNY